MKPLRDHVLLYDEVCPMCTAYSSAFVRAGMLDTRGRAAYQSMDEQISAHVDPRRAADEIALVNRKTGQVTYGVRSLMVILEHSLPVLAPLFRLRWFEWLAEKTYRFISFNRRVIMPSRDSAASEPSFSAVYRLLYLAFCWVVTSVILHGYSRLVVPVIQAGSFLRELLVCGGQMFWQMGFLVLLHKGKTWDYLGNLMTISLGGALLLVVIRVLSPASTSPLVLAALFTAVAGLMFFEHIRRTRILGISSVLS